MGPRGFLTRSDHHPHIIDSAEEVLITADWTRQYRVHRREPDVVQHMPVPVDRLGATTDYGIVVRSRLNIDAHILISTEEVCGAVVHEDGSVDGGEAD